MIRADIVIKQDGGRLVMAFLPTSTQPTDSEKWAAVVINTALAEARNYIMMQGDKAGMNLSSVESASDDVRALVTARLANLGIDLPPR